MTRIVMTAFIGQAVLNIFALVALWIVLNHASIVANEPTNSRVDFVMHNLIVNTDDMTATLVRTSNVYPLNAFFENRIVDNITELTLCDGSGSATIEETADNMAGPFSIGEWTRSNDCPPLAGQTVAYIQTWFWNDLDGTARSSTFRTNPVYVPLTFVN